MSSMRKTKNKKSYRKTRNRKSKKKTRSSKRNRKNSKRKTRETINIISSFDENEIVSFIMPCEEYYEDDCYDNFADADFVNIFDGVEDYCVIIMVMLMG